MVPAAFIPSASEGRVKNSRQWILPDRNTPEKTITMHKDPGQIGIAKTAVRPGSFTFSF